MYNSLTLMLVVESVKDSNSNLHIQLELCPYQLVAQGDLGIFQPAPGIDQQGGMHSTGYVHFELPSQ